MKAIVLPAALSFGSLVYSGLAAGVEDTDHNPTGSVRHDPFKKPASLMEASSPPPAQPPGAQPSASVVDLDKAKLTATLQAGPHSMVIVDNKTLQLGEHYSGYRLAEIKERSAVFSKDHKQVTLNLDKSDDSQ